MYEILDTGSSTNFHMLIHLLIPRADLQVAVQLTPLPNLLQRANLTETKFSGNLYPPPA